VKRLISSIYSNPVFKNSLYVREFRNDPDRPKPSSKKTQRKEKEFQKAASYTLLVHGKVVEGKSVSNKQWDQWRLKQTRPVWRKKSTPYVRPKAPSREENSAIKKAVGVPQTEVWNQRK
jgi:hypothetical protein